MTSGANLVQGAWALITPSFWGKGRESRVTGLSHRPAAGANRQFTRVRRGNCQKIPWKQPLFAGRRKLILSATTSTTIIIIIIIIIILTIIITRTVIVPACFLETNHSNEQVIFMQQSRSRCALERPCSSQTGYSAYQASWRRVSSWSTVHASRTYKESRLLGSCS